MKYLLTITAFLLLGATVNAQNANHKILLNKLVELSDIEDDSIRLEEYDFLAEQARFMVGVNESEDDTEGSSPAVDLEDIGDWETQSQTNPLDDSKTFAAFIEADKSSSLAETQPSLVLRCKSQEINVYIKWESILGDNADVTYRVGENDPLTENWIMSTDAKATFYPEDTVPFLKKLQQADRFVAQATPGNANPITAIFNIDGVDNIVPQVLSCAGK